MTLKQLYDEKKDVKQSYIPEKWQLSFREFMFGQTCAIEHKEDGTIEKWSMERDVTELKAEILTDITRFEEEIEQAKKLRNEAWDKLKDKGYDLVKPPVD